ncbi:MAG: prepilin-type N-terminal cleavage/methylation domain-containing protein [Candidatus Spechtbacteria bacterium]|nr:prepilin-type N-terminal cleavage/methylation domain-containing protein [Candidatus Spechtbacteria bacterium]
MQMSPRNNKGLTIIELIVYIGLLALVIALTSQFILGILRANISGGAQEELVSSIEQATDAIDRELRGATAVYTPTSVFNAHPGQLSLSTAQHLPAGEQVTYIDFFLSDDGRICMKQESLVSQCFTSQKIQVTSLKFVRLVTSGGVEAVQTLITAKYRSDQPNLQTPYSVQTTTVIRAGE